MLRKRIKKNTLKWKKIYAEQLLDMMDEEENALQKIFSLRTLAVPLVA